MNDYEAKKQARIERYRERARKAAAEAAARFNSRNIETVRGLMGEPIKIGHHSERRHRRLLELAERDIAAGVKADNLAEYYEQRAAAAERNNAISADDPEAVAKLRERLAELEAKQNARKSDNAALRKAKIATSDTAALDKMLALGISRESAEELARLARIVPYQMGQFIRWPDYSLTNNNANIRRVRSRLAKLEKQAAAAKAAAEQGPAEISGNGWRIKEDAADNRVCIIFPGKPAENVRAILKRYGFRWSPSRGAWVRMLNDAGRHAAKVATQLIDESQGG